MLKLLRKIRRALIESGSTKKYLLYAIGEIALVVIGILIALQINNWNQERINRKAEKEILIRIIEDLETDMVEIASSSGSNETRVLRGVWVLQELGENVDEIKNWDIYKNARLNPAFDSLQMGPIGRTLMEIRYYFLFEESNITIQEITATGKLDLIRDNDVKIAIQSHYAYVDRLQYLQRLLIINRDGLVNFLLDNEISTLNDLNLNELLTKIESPEKLAAHIENFLDATKAAYDRISVADPSLIDDVISWDNISIKHRTQELMDQIEEYLESI